MNGSLYEVLDYVTDLTCKGFDHVTLMKELDTLSVWYGPSTYQ